MTLRSTVCAAAALAAIAVLAPSNGLRAEDDILRIAESDARKAVVKKVEPEYPAMARQVRVSGQVQVDVLIDPSGAVESVKILRGNALLSNSAVAALKKWKFSPFLGAGNKPSKAITSLTFDFRLGD
jgi:TonB family protein